jgi:branched-chain amino acid transport system permease protein
VVHDTFFLRILTEAVMWIGLAISWDVLAGYAGYLNFGQALFWGLGHTLRRFL